MICGLIAATVSQTPEEVLIWSDEVFIHQFKVGLAKRIRDASGRHCR